MRSPTACSSGAAIGSASSSGSSPEHWSPLAGIVIDGIIVGTWINRGFGELSEERLLIFGSVLIILGLQAIFSSFFLSILGMARDRPPNWPASE